MQTRLGQTQWQQVSTVFLCGIVVVPIMVMVVFLASALVPAESHTLILARVYDTSLGALIGVLVTLFVLPSTLNQDINQQLAKSIKAQYL